MSSIQILTDVEATMRDGVVLRADVYRPTGDGPWPVVMSRLPYGKGNLLHVLHPLRFVEAGFIVVIQDTRGRFASDGEWDPWTFEEADGHDSVVWAASLPGSNGSVGMIGASYFGNTQWMAALSKAPGLKAIAPMLTWSDPDDGLFRRGGALELGLSLPWSLLQGVDTLQKRHATDPAAMGAALMGLVGDYDACATDGYWQTPADQHPTIERHGIPDVGIARSHRDPDWSASARVAGRHAEADLPTLNIGGWYDIFLQGTLDNYVAMAPRGDSHLVVGPWHHVGYANQIGDVNFGIASSLDVLGFQGHYADLQARWLRTHLAPDGDDGSPVLPPVFLFVMGINQWRAEEQWPLARAVDADLYLRADGRASFDEPAADEASDSFVHDPTDPVMTTGGPLLMSGEFRAGPIDQAPVESRPDVLVFTGEALADDLEVTGRVTAVLHVSSDAPTTDWVVRLCDVDADGLSLNVVDGIVRTDMVPGAISQVEVDLWSTSHVFRAGHRLRVHVTSSSFPRWDRNFNNVGNDAQKSTVAHQVVAHNGGQPSRLVLPTVPSSTT